MKKLLQKLGFGPKLSREAFEAYYHRLPETIEVGWFRNGKFIVGKVTAGDSEFMTQGVGADDFVDMVNDGVVMINRIPKEYIEIIKNTHTYNPPVEEIAKLRDKEIKAAVISAEKNKEVLQVV